MDDDSASNRGSEPPSPGVTDSSPPTSPLAVSPPSSIIKSSPVNADDYSSPLRPEFPSPVSSAAMSEDPSCSPSSPVFAKRKRYTLTEIEIPKQALYWPSAASAVKNLDFNEKPPSPTSTAGSSGLVGRDPSQQLWEKFCMGRHVSPAEVDDDCEELEAVSSSDESESTDSSEADSHEGSEAGQSENAISDGEISDGERSDHNNSDNNSEKEVQDISSESSRESESEEAGFTFSKVKIAQGHHMTVDEGVILIMELFLKHKLEKETVGDVLKTVLKFLPISNNMPKTQYLIFKYVKENAPHVPEHIHYYCAKCLYYMGKELMVCAVCGSSECNRFFQLPISNQIKNLFEHHNLAEIVDKYAEVRKNRDESTQGKYYYDITDGEEYKRAHLPGRYNLTLMAYSDGVSVSKSSNVSLYPLEFVICEVPPHLRYQLLIIAGVWLDSCKPNMTCFLKPFVMELQEIFDNGIAWTDPKTNARQISYVVAPCFCCDAPVRAQVQNILTHGGRYCCHNCEQKMMKLPPEPVLPGVKRSKRKRVFVWHEVCTLRTAQRMDQHMRVTQQTFQEKGKLIPHKGVRGDCIYSKAPRCDRSTFVYPEYMHIILGVMKQFLHLWFEVDGPWSLKEHRDTINTNLENIRVPDFVTRIPRSTECYKKWKANEHRSFLLYYSLVLFSNNVMKKAYFEHWMLLVTGLYLLLQDVISENDIRMAEVMIRLFLRDFSNLYRPQDFSYNLHNLDHLNLLVKRWGPLWSNSAFLFESFNGILSRSIHGTKNQAKELVNTIQLTQGVQFLKARCAQRPANVNKQTPELCSQVKYFKLGKELKKMLEDSKLTCIAVYYRALINRETFTCTMYQRQHKRNNFTVCFNDKNGVKSYGEINCFLNCFDSYKNNHLMVLVSSFTIEHLRMFCHSETRVLTRHIIPVKDNGAKLLLPLKNIECKVIRVGEFVCVRPNKFEINL